MATTDPYPDCLVLGGGLIGAAVAWRLAQRGLQVTLVDRGPPVRPASTAAAGMLAPQAEAAAPGPLLDLCLASRARWEAFAAELFELGHAVGLHRTGLLALAHDEDEAARLVDRGAWQRERGLAAAWLAPAELARLEPRLGSFCGALHLPDEAQVEPERLLPAVVAAAARAGVRFRRGEVRALLGDDRRATGALVDGQAVEPGAVVLAGGAWSSLLDGAGLPPRAVRPVRGQMIELSCQPAPVRHILVGLEGYLVPRPDGRLVCGSTSEEAGYACEVTAAGLAALTARAVSLSPPLAEARVLRTWAGLRPATRDGLPLLGSGRPGLYLATGHHRNGILLAPITADILAAQVTGGAPSVDVTAFSPARLAA